MKSVAKYVLTEALMMYSLIVKVPANNFMQLTYRSTVDMIRKLSLSQLNIMHAIQLKNAQTESFSLKKACSDFYSQDSLTQAAVIAC